MINLLVKMFNLSVGLLNVKSIIIMSATLFFIKNYQFNQVAQKGLKKSDIQDSLRNAQNYNDYENSHLTSFEDSHLSC